MSRQVRLGVQLVQAAAQSGRWRVQVRKCDSQQRRRAPLTGVDAEVLKGELEVGDVGANLHAQHLLRGGWGGGQVEGHVLKAMPG